MNPYHNSASSAETGASAQIDQVVVHVTTRRGTHLIVCGLEKRKRDRPQGTVAILEGAKVVASDGKPVGSIERVLAKPDANGPQHYLIAHALLLKERQLIPVEWIDTFGDFEVRLAAGASAGMRVWQ